MISCSPSDMTVAGGDGQLFFTAPGVSAVSSPTCELKLKFSPTTLSWSGSNSMLFSWSRSSYLRRRSSNSRSLNLRRLGPLLGARVAGTHCSRVIDVLQFEQGKTRLHLTFRCWHRTHARTRCIGGVEVRTNKCSRGCDNFDPFWRQVLC